jgi:threonine aldolase
MAIYSFKNDYSEGAHPRILKALSDYNFIQSDGYGEDRFSDKAAQFIKQAAQNETVRVHFVSGGTQANLICLASLMKPFQAVIAAETAHINVHEAGAIEATGHKICSVPSEDGKLTPAGIQSICDLHTDEHMVQPKVVFISNASEMGTVYSLAELKALRLVCDQNDLYLYMDGARLGVALAVEESDVTLKDITELVDVFYIGGTKNGALIGEAIVFCNPDLNHNFRFYMKQHGGLLAKGRVLGIQFEALFQDGLYFELATHSNRMAQQISESMKSLGVPFLTDSPTNQIFPILPNPVIEKLLKNYAFYVWSKIDETHSAVRLVISWSAGQPVIDEFIKDFSEIYLHS